MVFGFFLSAAHDNMHELFDQRHGLVPCFFKLRMKSHAFDSAAPCVDVNHLLREAWYTNVSCYKWC